MKISAAFGKAFRVCFGHFGATLKFLVVELCIRIAVLTPLLFLTEENLKWLALLSVPLAVLFYFPARLNAAAAMRDAFHGGSLFSYRLAEPANRGKKILYALGRMLLLALWGAPLIAFLVIAYVHIAGETDAFTLLRYVMQFGGGDLTTGFWYLFLILVGVLLLLAAGCAFHSGDRHARVRENRKLVKGHHGGIMLSWLCSLCCVFPMLVALGMTGLRYLPVLQNLKELMGGTLELPDPKPTLVILGIGAVLTAFLMPLRALIIAGYADELEKE